MTKFLGNSAASINKKRQDFNIFVFQIAFYGLDSEPNRNRNK